MNHGLALANLIIQAVLIVAAITGTIVARMRRLRRHCLIMRVATGIQILAIGIVMAPSLGSYIRHWHGWSRFTAEIVIHHTLGAIVILLFIYINLAFTGVVKAPRSFKPYMITALTLWLITLGMGIYLYWYIWR
jgi:hypothetical protein